MKRLLLAPLLITFLFGFRNKPDIINLVCNLDEISFDNKNYIYNQFMKRDYKITVNTKTEEANWYSVWLTDSPPQEFENVVITSKLIKVKRKSSGINDRKEPYFLSDYSYTINRINGEIINKIVIRYFDKNYKPTNKKELWIRGECIVSDDVETLF